MQKSSVAAFLATVLVAVPAGWHLLGANIQADGPGVRPAKKTIQVDGATVSIELDRGISTAGGKVKAILVATSDTPKEISLDVRALEDNGMGAERVANPPTMVSKQRVKVKAAPGGGTPVEVAFNLGTIRKKGNVQWFDIDVMSPKTKYRAKEWESTGSPNDAVYYDDGETPMTAARVGFAVWGGNSMPIAFVPPTIPASGPFEIAVKVKNTRSRAIDWLDVELGNETNLEGLASQLSVTAYGEDSPYGVEQINNELGSDPLEPGAERTFTFRITPNDETTRKFTFAAHAQGDRVGAVEVMSFERPAATEKPPIVGLVAK